MIRIMNSKTGVLLLAALTGLSIGLAGCTTTVAHEGHYARPTHVWYDYYYYPTLDIYLDISSGYYWYRDHDHWARVKRLPRHLHPYEHDRVFLRLDTDRPHVYHRQHREHYRQRPYRHEDKRGATRPRATQAGTDTRHTQRRDRLGNDDAAASPRARPALRGGARPDVTPPTTGRHGYADPTRVRRADNAHRTGRSSRAAPAGRGAQQKGTENRGRAKRAAGPLPDTRGGDALQSANRPVTAVHGDARRPKQRPAQRRGSDHVQAPRPERQQRDAARQDRQADPKPPNNIPRGQRQRREDPVPGYGRDGRPLDAGLPGGVSPRRTLRDDS